MKLAIRIFAMAVVFAGLISAPGASTPTLPSHFSTVAFGHGPGPMMPAPPCYPCSQPPGN